MLLWILFVLNISSMIISSSCALRIGALWAPCRKAQLNLYRNDYKRYTTVAAAVTRSSTRRLGTNNDNDSFSCATTSNLFAQDISRRNKHTLTYDEILEVGDGTLNPQSFHNANGSIPSPRALSPSAAAEFKACPQSYLLQYLYGIKQPTTLALAKGRICHSALEQLFDLEPHQRSLDHLKNLFRKNWSEERMQDDYRHLFDTHVDTDGEIDAAQPERDLGKERQWGEESLKLLEQYYELEDPRLVPRPNPIEREIWVLSKLSMDPSRGVTGKNYSGLNADDNPDSDGDSTSNEEDDNPNSSDTFLVRGIVDRLDYVAIPPSPRRTFMQQQQPENSNDGDSSYQSCVRIVDYKTGKAPEFKYSPATNYKIANDNMWQLKIYALLLREMIAAKKIKSKGGNLRNIAADEIRLLRLMYLTNVKGQAQYLDLDLGETQEERNEVLNVVHGELVEIWESIQRLVKNGNPSDFHHCDRKFCVCHKIRPKFAQGSLHQ